MAIVKMKRLRVIALAAQRDELLQRLLHAGCVEVTEPQAELSDPEWMALLKRDTSALSDVKARQNAVNGALEALQKYAPEKKGLFIHRRTIKEKEFLSDAAMNAALHSAGRSTPGCSASPSCTPRRTGSPASGPAWCPGPAWIWT